MQRVRELLILTILLTIVSSETIVPLTQNTANLATATAARSVTLTSTSTSQRISIKLQRPPIYAYPGIITDFLVSPALERTQDEIENMFQYQFSDNKFLPPRVYISLGERNDQIRVMFDYQNDIPFRPFSVRFRVADPRNPILGSSSITLVYDSISGGISNALSVGRQNDDFIR